MGARLLSLLLRPKRPSVPLGILVGAAFVAVETLVAFPVERMTSQTSLGIVYLVGVLAVSVVWGLPLGVLTAVASTMAYDFFHLPPVHLLTMHSSSEWIALPVFFLVSLLASSLATASRSAALEADERRREADLAADLARLLMRVGDLHAALPQASHRLARELDIPDLALVLEPVSTRADGRTALPLQQDGTRIGTLIVPDRLSEATLRRLRSRVVPSLETLLQVVLDHEAMASALQASHRELRRIAAGQAALRRVATLVAREAAPADVFNVVAREVGRMLEADCTAINRYEEDQTLAVVGSWSGRGPDLRPPVGSRWPMEEPMVPAQVAQVMAAETGMPGAEMPGAGMSRAMVTETGDSPAPGGLFAWARASGISSCVSTPIAVGGRPWGMLSALFSNRELPPESAQGRMLDFADLVSTAISNAEARAELAASRARVVAASDETRRRIERDLHDGAQQRLVSLALRLRTAEAITPPEPAELREQLAQTAQGLSAVVEDLQELSRGLHPAIISRAGLGPALKMLARRSAVPVELTISGERRLPERIEVTIYFIVSEALTNVDKHAGASVAYVDLRMDRESVRLLVQDDGVGEADPRHGSGLIGLRDRVEALGGDLEIDSPVGQGTSLRATIPVEAD